MADYQYKPSSDSHIVKLIDGLLKADCERILLSVITPPCAKPLPLVDNTLSTFEFLPLDEEYHEPLPTGHPIGLDEQRSVKDVQQQKTSDWDDAITRRSRLDVLPPPQFSTQSIPARFT